MENALLTFPKKVLYVAKKGSGSQLATKFLQRANDEEKLGQCKDENRLPVKRLLSMWHKCFLPPKNTVHCRHDVKRLNLLLQEENSFYIWDEIEEDYISVFDVKRYLANQLKTGKMGRNSSAISFLFTHFCFPHKLSLSLFTSVFSSGGFLLSKSTILYFQNISNNMPRNNGLTSHPVEKVEIKYGFVFLF